MSNAVKIGVSFAAGAVVGAVSAYIFAKKDFEAKTDEIIDREVESVTRKFSKFYKTEKQEKPQVEKSEKVSEKPDIQNLVAKYTGKKETINPLATQPEEAEEDDNLDFPYVISPYDFGEKSTDEGGEYDKATWTYYSDGIITDEMFRVISDEEIDMSIGLDAMSHFGEYEEDAVYIRNDIQERDYEVLIKEETYKDLTAKKPYIKED